MEDARASEHTTTTIDDVARHRWLRAVRIRARRLGTNALGASKRYRRSRSHGSDGGTLDESDANIQARVLVHFGLALRAHQDGDILKAIRHLTKTVESVTMLLQVWADPNSKEE